MAHIFNHRPNTPDHRDAVQHLPHEAAELSIPNKFDLWANFTEVPRWDQGQEGSCGGHAKARVDQHARQQKGDVFGDGDRVSPRYAYYVARKLMGTTDQDSGVDNRSLFEAGRQYGWDFEHDCPYVVGDFAEAPSDEAFANAEKHKGQRYELVTPSRGAVRININAGRPVLMGFSVPNYFEDENAWDPATHYLRLPTSMGHVFTGFIGGHDVVLTGYDYSLKHFDVPVFYVDNSWGIEWGQAFDAPTQTAGRFAIDARWLSGTVNQSSLVYDLTVLTQEA